MAFERSSFADAYFLARRYPWAARRAALLLLLFVLLLLLLEDLALALGDLRHELTARIGVGLVVDRLARQRRIEAAESHRNDGALAGDVQERHHEAARGLEAG